MQYELQLNLQYRAALSAALSFWEKKAVKDRVREFFGNCGKLNKCEARDEWNRLTRALLKELKQHELPSKVESELLHIIKEIGQKIYNWYLYVEQENASQYSIAGNAIDYVQEIHWTAYGTIDEVKILKSFWLGNPNLNIGTVYNIACSYLLKEHINDLWQTIPKHLQDSCYEDIYKCNDRHILAYWECYRDGDLHRLIEYLQIAARNFGRERIYRHLYNRDHSIEENMVRLSAHEGYSIAVQYFWDNLSEEERDRNLLRCARASIMRYNDYEDIDRDIDGAISNYRKEKYVEICIFFMNQMTIGHKETFFKEELTFHIVNNRFSEDRDVKGEILKMLLSVWPWQELVMPVFGDMLEYLERDIDTICTFLGEITKKMIEDERLGYDVTSGKYRNILIEVWHNIPRSIKHKIIQENPSLDFICNLVDIGDFSSMQLILNDPEIADIRDKYIESGLSIYVKLIKNDQYELLDSFIDEIFISALEKKDFKQKINIWEDFIKAERYDLADRLLEWQSNVPDERREIKGRIDHIKLCQEFIIKDRYDLADKLLDWQFDTEEERKECKNNFKNDIFSIKRVYNIWMKCRSDIEQSIDRSSKFLHWFLESEEEITSFKREEIAHLKSSKLLFDYLFMPGLRHIIDDFLSWCRLSEEEMKPLKQTLIYKRGYSTFSNEISMGHVLDAEELLQWAFSDDSQKMHSFIQKFIISDCGVESCSEFIYEVCSVKPNMPQVTTEEKLEKFTRFIDFWIRPLKDIEAFRMKFLAHAVDFDNVVQREDHNLFIALVASLAQDNDVSMIDQSRNVDEKTDHPDVLPKEHNTSQKSDVILGNKDYKSIPGIPAAFSSYYQDQVFLLLKLRLESAAPGVLQSVNVLEESYTLKDENQDYIAAELSSFILSSAKDTILMPLNIGGSHLVGIAAVKDGNNVVLHYMDSELVLPPESLLMKIESILESHSYSMELRIGEVERQKYSNCGPEVIENLACFATSTSRASQEEAILQHSLALEKHLLQNFDDMNHPDLSTSVAIFSGVSALNEKLIAQVQHYLNTGELFDSARAAIEDGTVSIMPQSSALSDTYSLNTIPMPSSIHAYNEERDNDSLETLYPNADFSPDINMVAIVGLLCSFLVSVET